MGHHLPEFYYQPRNGQNGMSLSVRERWPHGQKLRPAICQTGFIVPANQQDISIADATVN
jgi:hypothetical protein